MSNAKARAWTVRRLLEELQKLPPETVISPNGCGCCSSLSKGVFLDKAGKLIIGWEDEEPGTGS